MVAKSFAVRISIPAGRREGMFKKRLHSMIAPAQCCRGYTPGIQNFRAHLQSDIQEVILGWPENRLF